MNRRRPTWRRRSGGRPDCRRDRYRAPSWLRVEPHLPEIGFESEGGGETGGERREAPFAAAARELFIECRFGLSRQVLIFRTRIHFEPVTVAVAVEPGRGIGHALSRDHG